MDLQRARYFLEFAKQRTVTAAADSLGITQPALSRQLRRFETELGLELFDRASAGMSLNEAGKLLIPVCQKLVADSRDATRAVESIRKGDVRRLTVAATPTTISTILAPFIVHAGESIPLLRTEQAQHYDIYEALNESADMVVSPIPALDLYESVPLGEARVRAWVSPRHPWARRESVFPEDLAGEVIAVASRGSVSRVLFDTFISNSRVRLGEILECDDAATLMALARAGRAVAISSELYARGVVPLEITDGGTSLGGVFLHVAWRKGHFAHHQIAHTALKLRSFLKGKTAEHEREGSPRL